MRKSFALYFFKLTVFSLALTAVFPEKKRLKNRVGIFLLYKVWPVVFVLFWIPMVPMVALKAVQFMVNKNWDELLDIMHMFLVGCVSLYMLFVVQITSKNFQNTMVILETEFLTNNESSLKEFSLVLGLWFQIPLCFLLFVGGCIYYKENLVPLWLPLIDNNKELSTELFYLVWVYESLAGVYIFMNFTVWGPFIIVSTVCICKELNYLSNALKWFGSTIITNNNVIPDEEDTLETKANNKAVLREAPDMLRFVKKIVKHHLTIKRAINNVARINSYVFLVQTLFTVVHSCVLAFNLYYTTNVEKVMLKSSPILFFSYYLMFAYCWNGQQLTNKSEELVTALYHLPWYKCPHSYKTSMLIMMECLKQPVYLTGGGIIKATLETFITCFQQSFSYILVLKALTPEKGKTFLDATLQENHTTQMADSGT